MNLTPPINAQLNFYQFCDDERPHTSWSTSIYNRLPFSTGWSDYFSAFISDLLETNNAVRSNDVVQEKPHMWQNNRWLPNQSISTFASDAIGNSYRFCSSKHGRNDKILFNFGSYGSIHSIGEEIGCKFRSDWKIIIWNIRVWTHDKEYLTKKLLICVFIHLFTMNGLQACWWARPWTAQSTNCSLSKHKLVENLSYAK